MLGVFSRLAGLAKAAFGGAMTVAGLGAAKRLWGERMDQALSFLAFSTIGVAIATAAVWYAMTVWEAFFAESVPVLGEVRVLGRTDTDAKAIADGLPHLLLAELRRQRQELNHAINELTELQKQSRQAAQPQVEGALRTDIVRLIEKPVYPDIKVGDVDVSAILKFLGNRRASGDVLSLSVSYVPSTKDNTSFERALVYAHQTGRNGYSFAEPARPTIDDLASSIASAMLAVGIRRLDRGLDALTGEEFNRLLDTLKRYAHTARHKSLLGDQAAEEHRKLLAEVDPLAKKYGRWESLQRFALKVADEANDKAASQRYGTSLLAILRFRSLEGLAPETAAAHRAEIANLQARLDQLTLASRAQPAAGPLKICGPQKTQRIVDAYRPILESIGLSEPRSANGRQNRHRRRGASEVHPRPARRQRCADGCGRHERRVGDVGLCGGPGDGCLPDCRGCDVSVRAFGRSERDRRRP